MADISGARNNRLESADSISGELEGADVAADLSPGSVEDAEEIDGRLLEEMDADARLQSGVPEHLKTGDLDFIQMTGLTRPLAEAPQAEAGRVEDMDPQKPVSFFEKGVEDVDDAMAPRTLKDGEISDQDLIPERTQEHAAADREPSPAAKVLDTADLQDVVADLSREDTAPAEPPPFGDQAPEVTQTSEPMPSVQPEPSEGEPTEHVASHSAADSEPGPDAQRSMGGPPDFAETEQLLEELEKQPRSPTVPEPLTEESTSEHVPDILLEEESGTYADADEAMYRQPIASGRRSSRRRHSRARRRLIRWGVRLSLAALAAVAVGVGFLYAKPYFETPYDKVAQIQTLEREGRLREASEQYANFARTQPNHPGRAEAQFQAAYCMQLATADSFDEDRANKQRALQLFGAFVKDNPSHQKAIRAKVLMGMLHFRLEDYSDAVALLRDPALPLKDAESAVPALRTLARAYTQLGEYEAAVSAYLQAASMNGNYSPDVDYDELGNLFQLRAERAQNEEDCQRFRREAVEHWSHATRIPEIDPTNKAKVMEKRDWLLRELGEQMGSGFTAAPGSAEDRTEAAKAGSSVPEVAPSASAVAREPGPEAAPGPTPPPAHEAEPNPQAEAEYLSGVPLETDNGQESPE